MNTPHDTIAQALFDFSGSGQGVDDMLADIAASQATAILDSLKANGWLIVSKGAIGRAQRDAVAEHVAANDNRPGALAGFGVG